MAAFPCRVPEIAVTVTVAVADVGLVVDDVPPPPLVSEQPERIPRPAKATTTSSHGCQPRRRHHPKRQTVIASAVTGKNGRDAGCKVEDCGLVEMVSCVVAAPPEGVTVA